MLHRNLNLSVENSLDRGYEGVTLADVSNRKTSMVQADRSLTSKNSGGLKD